MHERFDRSDFLGMGVSSYLEVVIVLNSDPESIAHTERPREPKGSVGCYPSFAMNDLADPGLSKTCRLSQPVLSDVQRFQELRAKDLSGSYRFMSFHCCNLLAPLVVVNQFHVPRTRVGPLETDAVLAIDPSRMLPRPIPFQLFKTISGRDPQIVEIPSSVQQPKLLMRRTLKFHTESRNMFSHPDTLRSRIDERLDGHQSTLPPHNSIDKRYYLSRANKRQSVTRFLIRVVRALDPLSNTIWVSRAGSVARSIWSRNPQKSVESLLPSIASARPSPLCTFRAANNEAVP